MKSSIKKNLWWIITSIVLFSPIAFIICSLSFGFSDKLLAGVVSFVLLFLIWMIIGLVANKIKRIILKILWVILGLLLYAIVWFFIVFFIGLSESYTEENMENRKEGIRDMVYREFNEENYLDNIVGVQLPQYKIVDSECTSFSLPPTETEYNVELKIYFPKGLPKSVWNEISELAIKNASNPHSKGNVINKWEVDKDNPKIIYYESEDI